MHTSFLVLIILALVIVASIITSIVTYLILAGRNKRIRLAEQYQQIGITDGYLSIQEEIEKNIKSEHIKFTTVSPVKVPDFADEEHTEQESDPKDIWVIVRGKDSNTSEKIFEYWHFIYQDSRWICKERKKKSWLKIPAFFLIFLPVLFIDFLL